MHACLFVCRSVLPSVRPFFCLSILLPLLINSSSSTECHLNRKTASGPIRSQSTAGHQPTAFFCSSIVRFFLFLVLCPPSYGPPAPLRCSPRLVASSSSTSSSSSFSLLLLFLLLFCILLLLLLLLPIFLLLVLLPVVLVAYK